MMKDKTHRVPYELLDKIQIMYPEKDNMIEKMRKLSIKLDEIIYGKKK